jgi:hypothetical protein
MMSSISPRVLLAFMAVSSLSADQKKLTLDQRIEIMRGLTAEYATAKVQLPKSKKALEIATDGTFDKDKWDDAERVLGPAAKKGDLVQITHVDVDKDAITLEINGGLKSKGSWKDRIQIGMGGPVSAGTQPVGGKAPPQVANGTTLVLKFKESLGEVNAADVKKMLAPVIDFDKHSATDQYIDTLPPEIKKAITDKKPIEGMDRDQVVLALGKPTRKSRENKDGVDYEDWIYGTPPGRVTFVTFEGPKVSRVKETYAGLGGTIAETPGPPQ